VLEYSPRTIFSLDLFRLSRWCLAVGFGRLGGAVEKCAGRMECHARWPLRRVVQVPCIHVLPTRFRSAFFGVSSMIRRAQ
jgi:hypothetical protein